ncbi:hypothetical protein [uncultured Gemmiger sp.]|uniref:hypothetical protein n=1 Tax=uncultured Gemmiger sp. TaxID=1623490 RepID=UPI0025DA9247|nr:hypothetical protein [uncultured Gemmiger sp.]
MKIYDEALETELQNPDLTRGKLETAQRVTVHHDAVPASVRYEVMADTITSDCPDGLRQEITTTAQAAYDEYEEVQRYVPYTEAELAEIAAKAEAEKAAAEAEAKAAEQAAKEEAARRDAADKLNAQVTYTAMMTDTMLPEEG